jgi:hypothetical protein
MADLQTIPRSEVAFTEFDARDANLMDGTLRHLDGGILRAFPERSRLLELPDHQTHFGYISAGIAKVHCERCEFVIPAGFYFSLPGHAVLIPQGGAGLQGVLISRPGYDGFLQIGRIEERGRLRYIDGCTDSLLIAPIRMGDPCLNLLYFPPGIDQTMHTHPSDRIGMILSGAGQCITNDADGSSPVVTPLSAGMLFCIHTGGHHKFRTLGGPMRVLAYHPDSDFGPTDLDHPMINRTMVNGVSANQIAAIHTAQ